jgi:hypothetical protein
MLTFQRGAGFKQPVDDRYGIVHAQAGGIRHEGGTNTEQAQVRRPTVYLFNTQFLSALPS